MFRVDTEGLCETTVNNSGTKTPIRIEIYHLQQLFNAPSLYLICALLFGLQGVIQLRFSKVNELTPSSDDAGKYLFEIIPRKQLMSLNIYIYFFIPRVSTKLCTVTSAKLLGIIMRIVFL